MGKHWIVSAVIIVGFIAFGIGVPSPQVVVWNRWSAGYPPGTLGYFGYCSDDTDSSSCIDVTKDFYHCSRGDSITSYSYHLSFQALFVQLTSNGIDESTCQRVVAAEAFGLLAILFSFLASFAAVCRSKAHKHAGATTAFLAALFGLVALAVFFSANWKELNFVLHDSSISAAVNNGDLKLGYSAGFQIVGVVFSFFGSLLAAVYTKRTRGIPLLG